MDELEPDQHFQFDDDRAIERATYRDSVDYLLNESCERESLEARVATLVRPARINELAGRARRRSPDLADVHDRRSPDWPAAASPPETFGPTNVRGRETRAQLETPAQLDTTWTRTTGILALCASLLFGLFSFLPSDRGPIASTRPIELIRPGQRVLVDAPHEALAADFARLTGSELSWDHAEGGWKLEAEADPLRDIELATAQQLTKADYRLVKLQARSVWEDGTVDEINVETLQPWQWLQHHEVHVGGRAPLPVDALEMGLPEELTGKVLDILPCPPLRGGPGRIVLTTVDHLNKDVIELTLRDASGQTETLRPTGTHKFYSVTRGEWLSASQLENGERLDGVDGKITVVDLRPLPGTHRVYNMTVQGEHLYRVAQCGVLVHNDGCKGAIFDPNVNRFRDPATGRFVKTPNPNGSVKPFPPSKRVSNQTVLGKHPDYEKLSDKLGARRFQIPQHIWERMTDVERWAANQKFLDRMIKRGDDIILSNPVKSLAEVSGSFRKELDYLIGQGFRLSDDGTRLIRL